MKPMGLMGGVCLAFALGGCLGLGNTQATRFYVLTPLTDSATTSQTAAELPTARPQVAVELAPVTIPPYLDRPQIVTRISTHELRLADFDQWAEPLPDRITQVLAENLRRLWSPYSIKVLAEPSATRSTYQVRVTLMRFERDADNRCVLQARWTLVDEQDQSERVQNAFEVRIPLEASGYEAIVGALSRALGALSRDIALQVRAVVMYGTG